MYDVIIAGAGPAGCTAAKILAENGYRVLLAERFKMPRYKSCSGQLIEKTIRLIQEYFNAAVPDDALCAPAISRGMVLTNDKGKTFCFEQPGLNIWRSQFDCWLAKQAEQYGAVLRDYTSVISCKEEKDFITATLHGNNTYTETAKYLIDCEGVTGALKRRLLQTRPDYITTYQTYSSGRIQLDPHYFYAWLQPELSEYDAWFNVKDNLLVTGVSVKNTDKLDGFFQTFISYLEDNHNLKIDRQIKTDKWLMPHILPGCPIDYGIGRVLFAGEAAGFLNPMGEGISAGLESGFFAAQSVIQNFHTPTLLLADYQKNVTPLHDYMKRQWSFVSELSGTFREMRMDCRAGEFE